MKKWWGLRHIRYWYLRWRVYLWAEDCALLGIGLGYPNRADLDRLDEIREGRW